MYTTAILRGDWSIMSAARVNSETAAQSDCLARPAPTALSACAADEELANQCAEVLAGTDGRVVPCPNGRLRRSATQSGIADPTIAASSPRATSASGCGGRASSTSPAA